MREIMGYGGEEFGLKTFLKLIGMLISILLPAKLGNAILNRCKKTRNII